VFLFAWGIFFFEKRFDVKSELYRPNENLSILSQTFDFALATKGMDSRMTQFANQMQIG